MKIFVLGSTGMLGHVLCQKLTKKEGFKVYSFGRRSLNDFGLNSNKQIEEFNLDLDKDWIENFTILLNQIKPDFVINCVGVVKQLVKKNEFQNTININTIFVQQLDRIIKSSVNSCLIHLSTDCVFSGNLGNYSETDIVDPVDIYGLTKALGEIKNSERTLTIRTSIIGKEIDRKIGLLEWVLSQNKKIIKGYDKFIFSGLTTGSLSDLIINTILNDFTPGLMHISSNPISKYELLNKIKMIFNLDVEIIKSNEPICNRSLNSSYFKNRYNYEVESWDTMLEKTYELSKTYKS